jgi:hypothetical protein
MSFTISLNKKSEIYSQHEVHTNEFKKLCGKLQSAPFNGTKGGNPRRLNKFTLSEKLYYENREEGNRNYLIRTMKREKVDLKCDILKFSRDSFLGEKISKVKFNPNNLKVYLKLTLY